MSPSVYPDGKVCISILHPPGNDPNQYESAAERWSPVQTVEKILLSVLSMLSEPNVESPANIDAAVCTHTHTQKVRFSWSDLGRVALGSFTQFTLSWGSLLIPKHVQKMYRLDRETYNKLVKATVLKSLGK